MTSLAEPQVLLDAWELAVRVPPSARAAVLVHRAGLVPSLDDALDLEVGQCAALALQAYREAFGDAVDAVVACPRCGERLEAQLPADVGDDAEARSRDREQAVGAWLVRAPTTRDLLAAGREPGGAAAELRARCVRRGDGAAVAMTELAQLPDDELDALDAVAEELAGLAALVSVVSCPNCLDGVDVAFDAGAVLWGQVDATVPVLLADVAALARAFGWAETDVLALPPARRRAYLELTGR